MSQQHRKKLNLWEPGGDCVVQLSISCNFPRTYFTGEIPHGNENNKLHPCVNYFFGWRRSGVRSPDYCEINSKLEQLKIFKCEELHM